MTQDHPYQVLARKYRPQNFSQLVGQDVLVKSLSQAIESNKIPHAFIFSGVRGVGKTTTARILARAFNCVGIDGNGGPTIAPCGQCKPCLSVGSGQHMDVIEMDAASHTSVDDIRELIDAARYKAVELRTKVYIIDEVHMLSKSAFNALLKTLEEPPPHLKFIFATTEIHKVPATILSRCMRIDLKRIDLKSQVAYLNDVVKSENADADEQSLTLIARASEGSMRDALSLLDQALLVSNFKLTQESVASMLGIGNREKVLDLFEEIISGNAHALETFEQLYNDGADALALIQDLLDLCFILSRLKVSSHTLPEHHLLITNPTRINDLQKRLSIGSLHKLWQEFFDGIKKVASANAPHQTAEMILIKALCFDEISQPSVVNNSSTKSLDLPSLEKKTDTTKIILDAPLPTEAANTQDEKNIPSQEKSAPEKQETFSDLVNFLEQKREVLTASHLRNDVHLIEYRYGFLKFSPSPSLPKDFAAKLSRMLCDLTDQSWTILPTNDEEGSATLAQQEKNAIKERRELSLQDDVVQSFMEHFPNAKLAEK